MSIPDDLAGRQHESIIPTSSPLVPNTPGPLTQPAVVVINPDGTFVGSGGGGTTTVNQGLPNTASNAWPIYVTDGTNVLGTPAHPLRIDPTGTTTQPVSISGTVPVSGTVAATQSGPWTVIANAGTNLNTSALALESGGHLASLDSKFNSLGQKTSANSAPVVIASDQSAIPITGSITATNLSIGVVGATAPADATQVGGSFNTVLPTLSNGQLGAAQLDSSSRLLIGSIAGALPAGTNVIGHIIADSGSTTAVTGNVTVVQPTAANLNATITGSVSVSNFPATQPVSGTVTANQGTAAALAAAWPVEVTDGTNILGTSVHPVRVDPTGTTTQPISGTITANAGTGTFQENVAQIAGTTTAVNNGTTNAGTQRVTISSDSTGQVTLATGSNVIGHVIVDSGSITANAGTNLNTSALALESGGNLATIVTNTNRPTTSTSFQTSVTTSEAALATNTAKSIAIKAPSSNTDTIYIGTTGVTSSTGYLLEAGDTIAMDITNSNIIHAISNSGTQTLTILVIN